MKSKCLVLLILFLIAATLVACSAEEEPIVVDEPEVESYPEEEPMETTAPYTGPRNPLTFLPVDDEIAQMRPWAVVVNNLTRAMPHHGLIHADIIYELPVEGGITRLLALFQDIEGAGEIGPVRSARNYMLDIAMGHDALFIHAGGSPQAYEDIGRRQVNNIDGVLGTGREFRRDSDRASRHGQEHALMTTDALLLEHIDSFNYRRTHESGFFTGLAFHESAIPESGDPADEIEVVFSGQKSTNFRFDATSGRYYVYQHGGAHVDGLTDEHLAVTNVLVLFADFTVIDAEGRLRVDFTRGGDGYFATGGYIIPINWTKDGPDAPFVYSLQNGLPLEMGIGTSWINIVNENTGSVNLAG